MGCFQGVKWDGVFSRGKMGWGVFKGKNGMGCFQGAKWDGVFSRGKMGWGVFKG
jgi:hypothetical protein